MSPMLSAPLWLAVAIAVMVGLVLALLVLTLWGLANRLPVYLHPVMFIIGMLPVLLGFAGWAALVQGLGWPSAPLDSLFALCLILGISGLLDSSAYFYQWWRHTGERAAIHHPQAETVTED